MKKVIGIMLIALFVIGLPLQSFASQDIKTTKVNEYDMYKKLISKTDKELEKIGMKKENIKKLRSIDFNKELKKRSKLDEKTLKNMGYEKEQIKALKDIYKDTTESKNNENLNETVKLNQVYAAGLFADVYLTTKLIGYSTSKLTIRYNWRWSNLPVIYTGDDVVGFAWEGTNSSGSPLNVAIDTAYSYHKLKQVNTDTSTISYITKSLNVDRAYGSAKSTFRLGRSTEGMTLWYQEGYGNIVVKTTGSSIKEVAMTIAYGHTTYAFSSPSISFPGGFSISMGWRTDEMDKVVARYTSGGSKIYVY